MSYIYEWFKDGEFLFYSEEKAPEAYIHKETGEVSYDVFIKDFSEYEPVKIKIIKTGVLRKINPKSKID